MALRLSSMVYTRSWICTSGGFLTSLLHNLPVRVCCQQLHSLLPISLLLTQLIPLPPSSEPSVGSWATMSVLLHTDKASNKELLRLSPFCTRWLCRACHNGIVSSQCFQLLRSQQSSTIVAFVLSETQYTCLQCICLGVFEPSVSEGSVSTLYAIAKIALLLDISRSPTTIFYIFATATAID